MNNNSPTKRTVFFKNKSQSQEPELNKLLFFSLNKTKSFRVSSGEIDMTDFLFFIYPMTLVLMLYQHTTNKTAE
jgi:hypothetical protein